MGAGGGGRHDSTMLGAGGKARGPRGPCKQGDHGRHTMP